MEWELFNDKLAYIPAAATHEAGPLPFRLQPDDPILRWQNFLKNPTMPRLVDVEEPPLLGRLWLAFGAVLCGVGLAWIAARHGAPALRGQRPSLQGHGRSLRTRALARKIYEAASPGYHELSRRASEEVMSHYPA